MNFFTLNGVEPLVDNPLYIGNSYDELTYDGNGYPSSYVIWTNAGKTEKRYEETYTRDGGTKLVTSIVCVAYKNGVESGRITETYAYTDNVLTSTTRART